MLQNVRIRVFTVTELLRENEQEGQLSPPQGSVKNL